MTMTILTKARIAILRYLGGVDRATAQAETEWLEKQLSLKVERVSRMHQQIEDQIDEKEAMKQLLYVERGENNRLKREVSDLQKAKADDGRDYWQAQAVRFKEYFEKEREGHHLTRMKMYEDTDGRIEHLKQHLDFLSAALNEAEEKLWSEYKLPMTEVSWRADTSPAQTTSTVQLQIKPEQLMIAYASSELPKGIHRDMIAAELDGYFYKAFEKQVIPMLWDSYRYAYRSAIQHLTRN